MQIILSGPVFFHCDIWKFSKLKNGILLLLFHQEAIVLVFPAAVLEILVCWTVDITSGKKKNIFEKILLCFRACQEGIYIPPLPQWPLSAEHTLESRMSSEHTDIALLVV